MIHSKIVHKLLNFKPVKYFLATNRVVVRSYFDFLYRSNDPYNASSDQEIEKFNLVYDQIKDLRFNKTLEIGCGEGRFSKRLASLSKLVEACDISKNAIQRAVTLNSHPNVQYMIRDIVTAHLDRQNYDFIFCSETLYYLHLSQLDPAILKITEALKPHGFLQLVHSRSKNDDTQGLELKQFGSKTIHGRFANTQMFEIVKEFLAPMYHVILLKKRL